MEKPFDVDLVDALIARALQKSFDIGSFEPADPSRRAEGIAGRILSGRSNFESNTVDESWWVLAGFRLAIKLCCRILADPFHVHRSGVRRDVNSVLTWLDQRHRKQ